MNATPENFKPGERWLVWQYNYQTLRESPLEVTCIEWATSGKFVKIRHGISGTVEWLRHAPYLSERLPDVESGNNKTGQTAGVEAHCGQCVYQRIERGETKKVEIEITEAERREWAGKAATFFAKICNCEECKKKLKADAEAEAYRHN